MCFLIAMWVARRHHAFQIVDDPEFCEIVRMLYQKAALPSRVMVSWDVQDIHDLLKANVLKLFKNLPGKIHIGVDGWTSPNIISFLGVTAHWHEEGQICYIILDFVR
ncbi:hypothetical protein BD311DRAFT_662155 [Dichomitus squalens]|uniref:Uncharacterized protein n=1 Tax=Dichomitus squalens TaxID=114155 RepID=A0A4Q9MS33_9APHY|nr:hypothetical protein BD311DRAFT_662155 [Dichomitus squalens]